MQTPGLFLTSCLAALLVPPLCVNAQDTKAYSLKLDRPEKAGDKSRDKCKATIEKSQRVTRDDKVLKEEISDMMVELAGVTEVLEVNEKGKVRRLSFTVEKFILTEEGEASEEPFKPGTVITGI